MNIDERFNLILPIMNKAYKHWYDNHLQIPDAYLAIGLYVLKEYKEFQRWYAKNCHDILFSDREIASFGYAWLMTKQENEVLPMDL